MKRDCLKYPYLHS